ncbi:hypothetical protein [Treponema sp. R6D11]
MNRHLSILSVLFLFTTAVCLEAQPQPASTRMTPGLRRQALVLDIDARVLENEEVIWDESNQKITIPGTPVGIRLVGSNIIVVMQFTPFIRRSGSVMVAQGQIWITDPEKGVSYYTSIQTIPMEFNEPIYFFPLGTSSQLNSSLEIKLTVKPYKETAITENEK